MSVLEKSRSWLGTNSSEINWKNNQ
jgi:hypothetical protein